MLAHTVRCCGCCGPKLWIALYPSLDAVGEYACYLYAYIRHHGQHGSADLL